MKSEFTEQNREEETIRTVELQDSLHDYSIGDNFHLSSPYEVENRSRDIACIEKRTSVMKDHFPGQSHEEETSQTENLQNNLVHNFREDDNSRVSLFYEVENQS
jgi:hypothetical protein